MKKKYHINSEGIVSVCRAQRDKCPFGSYSEHFLDVAEAQEHADIINRIDSMSQEEIRNEIKSSKDQIQEIEEENERLENVIREYLPDIMKDEKDVIKRLSHQANIYKYDANEYDRRFKEAERQQMKYLVDAPGFVQGMYSGERYLFNKTGLKDDEESQERLIVEVLNKKVSDELFIDIQNRDPDDMEYYFRKHGFYVVPDDLNIIEFYRVNPRIRERDVEIYNTRFPYYYNYHMQKNKLVEYMMDTKDDKAKSYEAIKEFIKTKDFATIKDAPIPSDIYKEAEFVAASREKVYDISVEIKEGKDKIIRTKNKIDMLERKEREISHG